MFEAASISNFAHYHHTTAQHQTKYEYAAMIVYKYNRYVNEIGKIKIASDPNPSEQNMVI